MTFMPTAAESSQTMLTVARMGKEVVIGPEASSHYAIAGFDN
jgi:hypothetical protein